MVGRLAVVGRQDAVCAPRGENVRGLYVAADGPASDDVQVLCVTYGRAPSGHVTGAEFTCSLSSLTRG